MKFMRLLVIILVVGLLAVYYILGTDYGEQRRQKAALASQVAGAAQQLVLIPPYPTDLEQRLATASADLDRVKNSFPLRLNSTRLVNSILRLAEDAGVRAVPMVTQPWSIESVNKMEYPVFCVNIAVTGTFVQFADFIHRLENGEPGTLVICELKVDRTAGLPVDEGESGAGIPVEASLDIAVYARPSIPEPSQEVVD